MGPAIVPLPHGQRYVAKACVRSCASSSGAGNVPDLGEAYFRTGSGAFDSGMCKGGRVANSERERTDETLLTEGEREQEREQEAEKMFAAGGVIVDGELVISLAEVDFLLLFFGEEAVEQVELPHVAVKGGWNRERSEPKFNGM